MKTVLSEDGGDRDLAARLDALMPALSALAKAQKEAGPDPSTQNQQQAAAAAAAVLAMTPVSCRRMGFMRGASPDSAGCDPDALCARMTVCTCVSMR